MKSVLGVAAGVVVLAAAVGGYQYWQLSSAASRWSSAKEVTFEEMTKEGRTWKVRFEAIVDRPLDQVWAAIQQPERSSEFIPDTFKKSELKSHEGNKKVVEMQIKVLTLPIQTFLAETTYDDAAKKVDVVTRGGPQDLIASYALEPSPDGAKTRLVYQGAAQEKISVPLPESVQKGAMRELFVKQMRAIVAGIDQELAERQQPIAP